MTFKNNFISNKSSTFKFSAYGALYKFIAKLVNAELLLFSPASHCKIY